MALNKTQKYTLWGLGVGILGLTAFYVTRIVKQLKNFTLTFRTIKVNAFSKEKLEFDVFYNYTNNSPININLASQEYDVYINGIFITTMTNYSENVLRAKTTSPLGFSVKLNLPEIDSKIRTTYLQMITNPKNVIIRIEMKFKARVGFLRIPYRYNWNTNLKEILGWYIPLYK